MPLSPDLPADGSPELDSPAHLTPDERRRQVAAILARGALRLRSSGRLPSKSRQKAL